MTDTPSVAAMRFAYADPPYVGQAKRLYGKHKDYAGEVDHEALIARLNADYDGWALSASMKSLHFVLSLCPPDVAVLAWVKPNAPPFGDGRMYSWEPVIMRGGRNPSMPTRTSLVALIKTFGVGPEHVTGQKPLEFSRWLFACAGLTPDDEFVDIFPGSGAVSRAWEAFKQQPPLMAHQHSTTTCAHDSEGPTVMWLCGYEPLSTAPLWESA